MTLAEVPSPADAGRRHGEDGASYLRLVLSIAKKNMNSGAFHFRTSFKKEPGPDPCRENSTRKGYKFSHLCHLVDRQAHQPALATEPHESVPVSPLRNHSRTRKPQGLRQELAVANGRGDREAWR